MRYFAAHEAIYAKRLTQGKAGWADGDYDDHPMRAALAHWLSKSSALRQAARVLELGCGTGALSCQLAQAGHTVTGLDVSPSAIAYAQAMAKARGLAIDFVAADAGKWLTQAGVYDLVLDSHMLHCLALPRDRKAVLDGVCAALADTGELWTESMLMGGDIGKSDSHRVDSGGVVWVRTPAGLNSADSESINGEHWMPSRYLAPDAETLIGEFQLAGLELIEHQVIPPSGAGTAPDFRARFRKLRKQV